MKPKRKTAGKPWRVQSDSTGEFDELVVADWMHLERMDRRQWWMRLGQIEFDITIKADGQPRISVRNGKFVERRQANMLEQDGET